MVANIYMENLALKTATLAPRIWKRYADFCVMEEEHVSSFLDHLNSLHPTIQFTIELEKDGSLSFLDALLMRREDGTISTSVHRKPTHTDRYLHYTPHIILHM